MFEDGAMPNLKDVVEIRLIASRPRSRVTEVTEPSGSLSKIFAGDFGIGLPNRALIGEKAFQLRAIDDLPAE
jgi:hypothetical protein